MAQIQDQTQTQTQKQVIQHMMLQCIEQVRETQKMMTEHINSYQWHDDSYIHDNIIDMEEGEFELIAVLRKLTAIEKMIQ